RRRRARPILRHGDYEPGGLQSWSPVGRHRLVGRLPPHRRGKVQVAALSNTAPTTKVAELYGLPTNAAGDWKAVVAAQKCPFLDRKCRKNRKSEPEITIGTCTMSHGRQPQP